ncbi:hypothetical protein XELAEV_18020594mg [Xenopus laevis]|uniref:Uncharacterized protein n=1 Tax=Xenopus laevis TaxID=8355 RepID=A0A974D782_XENLA|nr:hypothetical protein XELAEV_18020594mg [Xenopus laevis]
MTEINISIPYGKLLLIRDTIHKLLMIKSAEQLKNLETHFWKTKKRQKTTVPIVVTYNPQLNISRKVARDLQPGPVGHQEKTQMNHYRHKIKTKSCDTPMGQHFCRQNHILQDMKVLILIKANFKIERERKIYEFKCIELFSTLRQGLNLGSDSSPAVPDLLPAKICRSRQKKPVHVQSRRNPQYALMRNGGMAHVGGQGGLGLVAPVRSRGQISGHTVM